MKKILNINVTEKDYAHVLEMVNDINEFTRKNKDFVVDREIFTVKSFIERNFQGLAFEKKTSTAYEKECKEVFGKNKDDCGHVMTNGYCGHPENYEDGYACTEYFNCPRIKFKVKWE